MNVVVLNDGEHATQMTNNSSLSTVVNMTAANDVGTNVLLRPAL
jgi:hypothetical protein